MTMIRIRVGNLEFMGRLEDAHAPQTCTLFKTLLPYSATMVHSCWSGEAGIIVLPDAQYELGAENLVSKPKPGDILFYPGGYSEPKILFPYGHVHFSSKLGQLVGNHFMTIENNHAHLATVDRLLLWQGAQQISFDRVT